MSDEEQSVPVDEVAAVTDDCDVAAEFDDNAVDIDETGEDVDTPELIIVGPDGEGVPEDFATDEQPQQPMSPQQMAKMAEMVLKQVDDDPTIIPQLPLDVGALTVWALECTLINGEPGIIITFAGPTFPRGIPFVLSRDRGLKFASQVKKLLLTGPSIEQRAAQAGISVPPGSGGGLILP